MKKFYFISTSLVILSLASCKKESIDPNSAVSTTPVVWKGVVVNNDETSTSVYNSTSSTEDSSHGGIIDPDSGTNGHPTKVVKVRFEK